MTSGIVKHFVARYLLANATCLPSYIEGVSLQNPLNVIPTQCSPHHITLLVSSDVGRHQVQNCRFDRNCWAFLIIASVLQNMWPFNGLVQWCSFFGTREHVTSMKTNYRECLKFETALIRASTKILPQIWAHTCQKMLNHLINISQPQ
jgi:hypothetical protein